MSSFFKIRPVISVALNLGFFSYILFMESLHWTVSERFGVLKADIQIGEIGEGSPIFMLPKGLTVKDVSSYNQIDLFEPHRLSITISSEGEIVDYSKTNHKWGNLYSAYIGKP